MRSHDPVHGPLGAEVLPFNNQRPLGYEGNRDHDAHRPHPMNPAKLRAITLRAFGSYPVGSRGVHGQDADSPSVASVLV
jgi:hypothetical protein